MKNLLNLAENLFHTLNKESVQYCVWKNVNELPIAIIGTEDIDILVKKEDFNSFCSIVESHGFRIASSNVLIYPFVYHFYGYDYHLDKIIHLHIFTRMITGESHLKNYHLPYEKTVINSARKNENGIYVSSPEVLYTLFLIRYYIKISCFPGFLLIKAKKNDIKNELDWIFKNLQKNQICTPINDFSNKLLLLMQAYYKNECSIFRKILLGLRVRLYLRARNRYGFMTGLFLRYYQIGYRILNKLIIKHKKRLINGGLIISITGSDGTGKSTITSELSDCLGANFDVKKCHVGLPPKTMLTIPYRALLDLYRQKNNKKNQKNKVKSTATGFGNILKMMHNLAVAYERAALGKKIEKLRNKGFIIICDRYITESFGVMDSPQIRSYSKNTIGTYLAKWEEELYRSIPSADLNIFLNVKLETAMERNRNRVKDQKESDSEIEFRYSQIENIVYRTEKNSVITAEGTLEETSKLVKKEVWGCL